MKQLICSFFVFTLFFSLDVSAQKEPEFSLEPAESEAHLRFLASDELEGRRTGSQSNRVAARYIAEQFRKYGVSIVPGHTGYYQDVFFEVTSAGSSQGLLIAGSDSLAFEKDWLLLSGIPASLKSGIIYAGYGLEDNTKGWNDYQGLDVKGKVVLVQAGYPDSQMPRESLAAGKQKTVLAESKGAVALIEMYNSATPWNFLNRFLAGERIGLADSDTPATGTIPHIWVNGKDSSVTRTLRGAREINFTHGGRTTGQTVSYNVAGYIEGSDPKLKDEYILLSAHYDHVGVGKQGGQPYTEADSIFNGARDNAFGVAGLLAAAKSLTRLRPKRSVLLVAFTGEELGLLGSRYYANHPLLPLNRCIFNLNNDGAGYTDTGSVSVIGLKRTGASASIELAAKRAGLEVIADPVPEQNLFDRSDNVNFASKGIPAPTFSPGFREFGEELMKYYHQAADNPDTIDFDYLLKYCKAYAHAARLIANLPQPPRWINGDKYESAAAELYGLP